MIEAQSLRTADVSHVQHTGVGENDHVEFSCLGSLSRMKQAARADRQRQPDPLPPTPNPVKTAARNILTHPREAFESLAQPRVRAGIEHLAPAQAKATVRTIQSPEFPWLQSEKQRAYVASHAGIGVGKMAQMVAGDRRLPNSIRKVGEQLKSGGAPTRNLTEARGAVTQFYGKNTYHVTELAGVGTIGEVYHAVRLSDARPVVIKMLKKNVNQASLDAEKQLAKELIRFAYPPEKQSFKRVQIENAYRQFGHELDFSAEAQNAEDLSKHAKRYKVAQPIKVAESVNSGPAPSVVFEKAEGIALDKLTAMLKVYRQDPARYRREFSRNIAEHPWLATPETWMHSVPRAYRRAMNEQSLLRVRARQNTVSHGDPHTGNVFFSIDPKTNKPILTFIDTGLVALRSSEEVSQHSGFMLSLISGDAKSAAKHLIAMAENPPIGAERLAMQARIADMFDTRLFKAHVNVTNMKFNSALMNKIMEDEQLNLSENNLTFIKSQFQTVNTYGELSEAVGATRASYLRDSVGDIARGVGCLLLHLPVATVKQTMPTISHFFKNPEEATTNLLQFYIKKPTTSAQT